MWGLPHSGQTTFPGGTPFGRLALLCSSQASGFSIIKRRHSMRRLFVLMTYHKLKAIIKVIPMPKSQ
jgi:hypothetical protein